MSSLLIGCARVSTEEQDLTAQRDGLARLSVEPLHISVDHGLTGTNRPAYARHSPPARPRTPSWRRRSTGSTGGCPTRGDRRGPDPPPLVQAADKSGGLRRNPFLLRHVVGVRIEP